MSLLESGQISIQRKNGGGFRKQNKGQFLNVNVCSCLYQGVISPIDPLFLGIPNKTT